MVVGGSVIKDSEEPSNECPVGGYHRWEEARALMAHVCALCGRTSAVTRFERPSREPSALPRAKAAPQVSPVERQAS